jgi:3-phenylpropionate/trans-cinnamate dioxygenase ferredoxin subunit
MTLHKLCPISEIPINSAKRFKISDYDIAVFNVNGKFYAIDRKCTHLRGNLAKGTVKDKTVTCPVHGAVFDLETGELKSQPGTIAGWLKKAKDTKVYSTKIKKDELYIEIEEQ